MKECSSLELTAPEIEFLQLLGQYAFLPVGRKNDDPAPIYPLDGGYAPEDYTRIIALLERKGLVSLDYSHPLKGFESPAYDRFPQRGSIALTARGQSVLELMEIQGVEE